LAWLEDYLQTWPGTLVVVWVLAVLVACFAYTASRSHDRAFLDAVSTDIIHQHSGRLDYYKGYSQNCFGRSLTESHGSNFTQFYSTKSERERNLQREYDAQMEYRKHLQAFIDRWRYNANRAAQAQSKIKILEKVELIFCLSPLSYPEYNKYSFQSSLRQSQRKRRRSGM
jgi:ATP-binding cassette, subfamily F, member 3